MEIVGGDMSINRKVKCLECGFSNEEVKREVDVLVIRKRIAD